MKYSFHAAAEVELSEAIEYYEKCKPGLGLEFAEEIYRTIDRILQFPEAWTKLSRNSRRCIAVRFPYGVIYQIHGSEVLILAVMQLNRRPGYWAARAR